MNEHDSYRMVEVLARQGYAMTEEVSEASLVILNLLGAAKPGEQGQLAGPVAPLAQRFEVIIGVGGCVAQRGEKFSSANAAWTWCSARTIISGCPK